MSAEPPDPPAQSMTETPGDPAPGAKLTVGTRTAASAAAVLGATIGAGALAVLPAQTGTANLLDALDAKGPGFFPLVAGILTLLAGAWCLIDALRPADRAMRDAPEVLPWRPFLRIAAWLAVVAVGMHLVGMLVAMGLATAGLAGAFGERRPLHRAALGVAVPLVIFLVFEFALKILFPRGGWF